MERRRKWWKGDGGSELALVVESPLGAAAESSSDEPERVERTSIIRLDDSENLKSCLQEVNFS